MMRMQLLIGFLLLVPLCCLPQDSMSTLGARRWHLDTTRQEPTGYKLRQWAVSSGSAAAFGGSFIFLNRAWYREYPRAPFHFFNDAGEWLQLDKTGHAWTTYTSSRLLYGLWRWAGLETRKAVWISALSSFTYMASIEYLDGRSAEWGWSWGDIAGNTVGASLFAVQQLAWNEQKVQLKFSAHIDRYDAALEPRANALFGKSPASLLLKDYNAQTYWFSSGLKTFLPHSRLPDWLGLAVGYGGEGMWGGFENTAYDQEGLKIFDRTDIRRNRQWYLAPDIDLTRIRTKSKALRTALFALNAFKIPLPGLKYSAGRWSLHAFLF